MADCRLMLQFNGGNGTTSTVDEAGRHPTITFNGTAAISTTNPKFGVGCLLLDGDSDYLTIPASADWNVLASLLDDWTIELWVKHDDHALTETYLIQQRDANNYWMLDHVHGSGLRFASQINGSSIVTVSYGGEITDTLWHHVALCKVGDDFGTYLDGQQVGYGQASGVTTFAAALTIGATATPGSYFDGRMDQIRIDKFNHFGAAPNVGLTDSFSIINPIGRWTMDDDAASTTVLDSSGNGYDATLAGGDNTEDKASVGQIDGAFNLNGTDDYADAGATFEAQFQSSFTISILLKPADGQPAAIKMLCGAYETGGTNAIQIYFSGGNGKIRCDYTANSNTASARSNGDLFSDGAAEEFSTLTIVFDSTIGGVGGILIYFNGALVTLDATYNGDTSGVTFSSYSNTRNLFVGARNTAGSASYPFAGFLDDFMLIPKAITAAQVLAIHNAAVAGRTGATEAYEAYELLGVFPTMDNSPLAESYVETLDERAVRRASAESGYPMIAGRYTFDPKLIRFTLDYVSQADKASLETFYSANKDRAFLWYNDSDGLKYQVTFASAPRYYGRLSDTPWRIEIDLLQVSSQTVS